MAAVSGAARRRRLLLPLVVGLLAVAVVAVACWRAPISGPGTPSAGEATPAASARVAVGASQRFDMAGMDTPFAIGIHGDPLGSAPELIAAGPSGAGQALRLAFDAPAP